MHADLAALVGFTLLAAASAHAATPCDFKGLSVGDKATPVQIMKHFGIDKFVADSDAEFTKQQAAPGYFQHVEKVGIHNAAEEVFWKMGPSCNYNSCEIPFGVSVGSGAFPIPVGVFVSFAKDGTIEAIDVSYSTLQWDEVMELLNTKYGNNWRTEVTSQVVTDYATKKSESMDMTEINHRSPGTNAKTGDKCTLHATSLDAVFTHTMPPTYRAELEIKLMSKNF